MNSKNLRILAAVVVFLVLTILVVERTDDLTPSSQGQNLLPGFGDDANKTQQIHVSQADADALTLRRESNRWVVATRDDYPADIGKLRPFIIALAEAKVVEEKTSNPELYEKLGVDDPENGGSGARVTIEGEDFSYSVILGESAPGKHRYARIPDGDASFLIDRNPQVPEAVGDWLFPEIIDIDSQSVQKVSIVHEDGETITIEKNSQDLTDFAVLDVPQGRELSYATVGNGIAGSLSDLQLDDVRKTSEGSASTSTIIDTWDGLRVNAQLIKDDDEFWVAFSATATSENSDQAAEINDRLSGWQYRLPDHKKNLLTRRWEDILKSVDKDEGSNKK
jgi:hypothetical protein